MVSDPRCIRSAGVISPFTDPALAADVCTRRPSLRTMTAARPVSCCASRSPLTRRSAEAAPIVRWSALSRGTPSFVRSKGVSERITHGYPLGYF